VLAFDVADNPNAKLTSARSFALHTPKDQFAARSSTGGCRGKKATITWRYHGLPRRNRFVGSPIDKCVA